MKNRVFKRKDLNICDWQYTIRHTNTNSFMCGEKVFLKSNPEHSMIVYSINNNNIITSWYNIYNELQLCEFPPECILQYKYAGFLTYQDRFHINLN